MTKKTKEELALEAYLAGITEKKARVSDKLLIAHNDAWRASISKTLKGKTLEELLGKERAEAGREARRQANSKIDYTERRKKGAATRRAAGGYDVGTMTGKQHKESTKSIMSIKAEIRQQLKRQHGLGKSDKVPQELLDKAYKKAGLV